MDADAVVGQVLLNVDEKCGVMIRDVEGSLVTTGGGMDSAMWSRSGWFVHGAPTAVPPVQLVGSPEVKCLVCLSKDTNVALDPCGHQLCSNCVPQLSAPACPICRAVINNVYYVKDDLYRSFDAVKMEQIARDNKALEATVQVLVLGPAGVGKKTLVEKITHYYPLFTESERDYYWLSGTFKNSQTATFEEYMNKYMAPVGRFSPNALIKNTAVRFSSYNLPPFESGVNAQRAVVQAIHEMKPDVVILTCSCHRRRTLVQTSKWDKLIQKMFPEKQRIWCLLKTLSTDPLSTELVDRSDVYNALKDLAIEDYPKGIFVASPKSLLSRGNVKAIATSALKLGRKAHGMQDQTMPTTNRRFRLFRWMERVSDVNTTCA